MVVKYNLWSRRALGILRIEYCQSADQIQPTDLFDDLFANIYNSVNVRCKSRYLASL